MKDYGMLIDVKYCTGCHVCELSCKNEHEFADGEFGIKVNEIGPVKLAGNWMWDYVPVPSDLCDLCEKRLAAGQKPSCEMHCLGQCLEVLPIAELANRIAQADSSKISVFIP